MKNKHCDGSKIDTGASKKTKRVVKNQGSTGRVGQKNRRKGSKTAKGFKNIQRTRGSEKRQRGQKTKIKGSKKVASIMINLFL